MLRVLRQRKENRRIAASLCACLAMRAREPEFYTSLGVNDTFDGRFDLLAFHAWMVLDALQTRGERELAQQLVDQIFVRLDEALREQGAGDMGISRRMKTMAGAFYGRMAAYGEARDSAEMAEALLRNLYRGETSRIEPASLLAKYARDARSRLASSRLQEGDADFGPLPTMTETNNHDGHPSPTIS